MPDLTSHWRLRHLLNAFCRWWVLVLAGGLLFSRDESSSAIMAEGRSEVAAPGSVDSTAEVLAKPRPRLPMPKQLKVFRTEPVIVTDGPIWSADQTPADFLDGVSGRLKARWRQLYREPPPPPSTDRQRAAFALGALLADCYLTLQATDAQQFKNTSQDILGYCRVLALGEKMTPRFMSAANLAESEKWLELRQDVVDGHQELCRLMREQRDDDLATLVDLGVWLRMIEVVSTLVVEAKDSQYWPLTAGSAELVVDLRNRFASMSQTTRTAEKMLKLGEVTEYLAKVWGPKDLRPEQAEVMKTHERVSLLLRSMTLK
jgi:hypothetical protein